MPSTAMIVLFPSNHQVVEVEGLRSGVDGSFKNSAVVTATLKDPSGGTVAGVDGLTLSYVPESDGVYRGVISGGFDPPVGSGYVLYVNAVSGGENLHIELPTLIEIRRS